MRVLRQPDASRETASSALLLAHDAVLRRYARRCLPAYADDLVQETYAQALTSCPPRESQHLRGWLCTVLHHVAVNWIRHAQVEARAGPQLAPQAGGRSRAHEERVQEMQRLLGMLSA